MRIAANSQINEIADRTLGSASTDNSLARQPPQHLRDLQVEHVRRMQAFVMCVQPVLNPMSGRCLKQPIDRGGRIYNDHGLDH